MTDKNYMKRRFKCRCYQKDNTVKIYDDSEILFDVSYRDFDDAFYLGRKLQSVIMELNELHEENQLLKLQVETKLFSRRELEKENEQLKQQIKDLRIDVLDSIHEADEIKCTCNPCVVEECVKRVVE